MLTHGLRKEKKRSLGLASTKLQVDFSETVQTTLSGLVKAWLEMIVTFLTQVLGITALIKQPEGPRNSRWHLKVHQEPKLKQIFQDQASTNSLPTFHAIMVSRKLILLILISFKSIGRSKRQSVSDLKKTLIGPGAYQISSMFTQ